MCTKMNPLAKGSGWCSLGQSTDLAFRAWPMPSPAEGLWSFTQLHSEPTSADALFTTEGSFAYFRPKPTRFKLGPMWVQKTVTKQPLAQPARWDHQYIVIVNAACQKNLAFSTHKKNKKTLPFNSLPNESLFNMAFCRLLAEGVVIK